MAATPPGRAELVVFPCAPVLDPATTVPDGLLHKFGITQDEHPVEIVRHYKLHAGWFQDGPCEIAATRRVRAAGVAHQVSMHLVPMSVLPSVVGALGSSCHRVEALNFSDAQI